MHNWLSKELLCRLEQSTLRKKDILSAHAYALVVSFAIIGRSTQ